MTHMAPMPDSAGEFDEWKKCSVPCPKCKGTERYYRVWESSCGGYEDEQHECRACGWKQWFDGPDS